MSAAPLSSATRGLSRMDTKGRPSIKPSGMEQATEPKPPRDRPGRRGRGKVVPRVAVEERVLRATVPPGSRFQGYQDFLVQDLVLRAEAVRDLRERWLTPDGRLIVAALPGGVDATSGRNSGAMCWRSTTRGRPRCRAWLPSYGRLGLPSPSGRSCAC